MAAGETGCPAVPHSALTDRLPLPGTLLLTPASQSPRPFGRPCPLLPHPTCWLPLERDSVPTASRALTPVPTLPEARHL